ncbi:hypothetical protein [Rufibacter quisquiliarum]|uniref:Uncharacterized protein n=1 Tax=Rufibacter quisquiliarum TaxID=1549639 RepID=A0A839GJD1_9BACT|nr:hypothetical protein [Rufibacter quisquiliarum]MBA9077833.1 hypothetical protein [Rufibacter quisquiliarum]
MANYDLEVTSVTKDELKYESHRSNFRAIEENEVCFSSSVFGLFSEKQAKNGKPGLTA